MSIGKLGASIKASVIQNTSPDTPSIAQPAAPKLGAGGIKDGFELAPQGSDLLGLQGQLGKVEIGIKNLMSEIDAARKEEQEAQGAVKSNEEQQEQITANLDRAAQAYEDLLRKLSGL